MSKQSKPNRPSRWTDDELLRSFEELTLDPEAIDHELHVRLAWTALRRYPLAEALERQTEGLRRYVEHHGASEKYHATITWAHLLLIHERMARDPEVSDGREFVARNRDLVERGGGGVLARYYDSETLSSDLARRAFVLPDRGLADPIDRGPLDDRSVCTETGGAA